MANETRRYKLTNCVGQISPLYTEQDLSQYLGKYVSIQGSLQCYLVSEVGCETVKVSFNYIDTDYSYELPRTGVQNGFGYYSLNLSSGPFNRIIIFWDNTPANPSDYGWRVDIRSVTNDFSSYLFNSTNECPLSSNWGFYQDGSEFEVDGLEVDFSTPALVESCDCIQVTYQLVGENIVTTQVQSSEMNDGKPTYSLSIGSLLWSFDANGNWIFKNLEDTLQAFLSTTNDCPFGNYSANPSVFKAFEVTPCSPPLVVESCFQTCEECSAKAYRVYSCNSEFEIFSTDPRLELLASEDQVIRIPFYNDGCFRIEQVSYDRTRTYIPALDYSGIYNNCIDCYPKETVEPLIEFGICDPQKVVDIKCDFAEMMYQQMMSRRLGIEFCCPIEKGKATLKNDIIDFALLPDELPDLPEPYVEYCCIPLTDSCSCQVTNCGCRSHQILTEDCGCDSITINYTLVGGELVTIVIDKVNEFNGYPYYTFAAGEYGIALGVQSNTLYGVYIEGTNLQAFFDTSTSCPFGVYTIEEGSIFESFEVVNNCPPTIISQTCKEITVAEVEDCNCTASENSPHPCHTYQITVLGNQLLLAAGNTNGSLNGKVYFAYFKCKATKPTVVEYTTAQTNPYCVLGIPVFGYYANNIWIDLPLTRGEECPEEEITNTCCNG